MFDYRDQILIEITGHDHIADFRTHSAAKLFDKEQKCMKASGAASDEWFLGKLISPAVTPGSWTNPGFTTMTLDTANMKIQNLQMTFLQLQNTTGMP